MKMYYKSLFAFWWSKRCPLTLASRMKQRANHHVALAPRHMGIKGKNNLEEKASKAEEGPGWEKGAWGKGSQNGIASDQGTSLHSK